MNTEPTDYFYLFIDDDKFTNHINEKMINRVIDRPHYAIFHNPVEALMFLKDFDTSPNRQIILFLDLEIPLINGLDILKLLHKDEDMSQMHIKTYILSSYDKLFYEDHFSSFKNVKGYINKPLSIEEIKNIVENIAA